MSLNLLKELVLWHSFQNFNNFLSFYIMAIITKNYESNRYYFLRNRGIRHIVQLIMFILLKAAIIAITATWLTLPINQPPTPFSISDGAIYVGTVLTINVIFPFIPLAMFFIIGSLFGRALCGWVCPFGFFQDLLALIPIKKYHPNKQDNERAAELATLIALVYIFFSVFIGLAKLVGTAASIDAINSQFGVIGIDPVSVFDPAATLFAYIPYTILNTTATAGVTKTNIFSLNLGDLIGATGIFWFRLSFLVFIVLLCIFIPRAYCRYLCPTGAIMGAIGKNSLVGLNRNLALCNQCGTCEVICPVGVRILDHPDKIRDPMCISCNDCVYTCDTGALSFNLR